MECLSQYSYQMDEFAKHINGILEGKIRDDEGKLVEVLIHDKPQANGSIGVALNQGCPPIFARMDENGDIQYWDSEGGVLYDSRFQPVDPSLYAYVLYGTGNKYFDGKSCEALNYSKADGKCQVRVGESVTWVDSSMLWKSGQDPTVKESLPVHHSPGSTKMVDHSVKANKLVPPVGYRLLHESAKVDPRKAGDWYWSLKLRKWIVLREDVVEYANRDDWPACRLGQSDSVVKENLKTKKWTPKVGDWVRINRPIGDSSSVMVWSKSMDEYDKQIVPVRKTDGNFMIHDTFAFVFDWLEPAEAPKATPKATQEVKPPDGWRWIEVGEKLFLGDTTVENGKPYLHSQIDSVYIQKTACNLSHTFIRRNRFEVGEKVVRVSNGMAYEIIAERPDGTYELKNAEGAKNCLFAIDLAPCIEEPK